MLKLAIRFTVHCSQTRQHSLSMRFATPRPIQEKLSIETTLVPREAVLTNKQMSLFGNNNIRHPDVTTTRVAVNTVSSGQTAGQTCLLAHDSACRRADVQVAGQLARKLLRLSQEASVQDLEDEATLLSMPFPYRLEEAEQDQVGVDLQNVTCTTEYCSL